MFKGVRKIAKEKKTWPNQILQLGTADVYLSFLSGSKLCFFDLFLSQKDVACVYPAGRGFSVKMFDGCPCCHTFLPKSLS